MNRLMANLCVLGVGLNTGMFVYNLFSEIHQFAVFNLLCAGGCWLGYFKYKGEQNGD